MDDVTPISTPSRSGVAQRPTGGLLNREKTAFRRDTLRLGAPWSKHVRYPKALPLSMLLRLQQTTVNGGLLNREKTAFRRDTLRLGAPWSKHVRYPKALPLSMLLRFNKPPLKSFVKYPAA